MIDKINKWLVLPTAVLVLLLAAGLVGGNQSALGGSTDDDWSVGGDLAITGTSVFTGEIRAPVVELGVVTTLTATSTAQVLTAAQMCDSNVIIWDNTTVSSTLTLAASTTLVADCLTADGDFIEFIYDNISTSTTVVTVTVGAGTELIGSSNTNELIDDGNQARISIWRVGANNLFAQVEELIAID